MRFAIYYTPARDDPLTEEASRWLGRDAWSGEMLDQPALDWLDQAGLAALTADPRRYGFHATLKPPFELKRGRTADELISALTAFCARTPVVHLEDGIAVSGLGPFFALTSCGKVPALDDLAAEVVKAFEPFRAPLSTADMQRRLKARLSPRQETNLQNWGYPYVFEDFRFHMTLTGIVPEPQREQMQAELETRFAGHTGRARTIDNLCLFTQETRDHPFTIAETFTLAGDLAGQDAQRNKA